MAFRFIHKKAIHIILFVLHSLGKVAEPSRLFLLLYLADLRHLAKYGTLVTGDNYIAMKNGPAPVRVLAIYKQLREDSEMQESKFKAHSPLGINNVQQLVALEPYSVNYLSEQEVESLFETMHLYKNASLELLSHICTSEAWNKSNINGEISLMEMAYESGATPEKIESIMQRYNQDFYPLN